MKGELQEGDVKKVYSNNTNVCGGNFRKHKKICPGVVTHEETLDHKPQEGGENKCSKRLKTEREFQISL